MYTFQWVYLWEYVHSASRHRSYCIICCTRSEFAPFINLVNTSCCHCCCCCCFQHHRFQFLFNWQIFLELSWVRSHKSELSGNCWSLQAGCPTCHQTSCIIALMGRRIHVNLPYFTSPYLTSALALCANKFNYICLLVIYFRTPFSLYRHIYLCTADEYNWQQDWCLWFWPTRRPRCYAVPLHRWCGHTATAHSWSLSVCYKVSFVVIPYN